MDVNGTAQNEENSGRLYMGSRLNTSEIHKEKHKIDFTRSVQVRTCNCHMLIHFKSAENCICIRNMKPFVVEHEKSTIKAINDNIVKAISSIFGKFSNLTRKPEEEHKK
jgi:hypothetical protein